MSGAPGIPGKEGLMGPKVGKWGHELGREGRAGGLWLAGFPTQVPGLELVLVN